MIFIATGADASANNLGKISIKSIEDIATDTVVKLDFFGKTWTDEQKIAIDDFLVAFNAATWKSKIKVISMPILLPIQNKVTQSVIETTGSKFRKNIADWNNEITADAGLALPEYGYIGVSQNGVVLQNNEAGDNPTPNLGLDINTTSFGITNKAFHYGVFYKSTSKFRSGTVTNESPAIIVSDTMTSSYVYNNIHLTNISNSESPKKQLFILNGDVTVSGSKSYVFNQLVQSEIINELVSTTQVKASVIKGYNDNSVNDSTACYMTFGDFMTDAELLEYGNLINTLMDVLII